MIAVGPESSGVFPDKPENHPFREFLQMLAGNQAPFLLERKDQLSHPRLTLPVFLLERLSRAHRFYLVPLLGGHWHRERVAERLRWSLGLAAGIPLLGILIIGDLFLNGAEANRWHEQVTGLSAKIEQVETELADHWKDSERRLLDRMNKVNHP